jgi:release factor glutamine methyltransferase
MDKRPHANTIAGAITEGASVLHEAGVSEARREAGSLLMHALARDRAYLITHADEPLSTADLEAFRLALMRRANGEPLQYITNRQEFYGLDFEVTPDVLIPRPETELLVETALELLRGRDAPRVCDVGTGSGCIVVTLLHERTDARGVGIDISASALNVAARNATRHAVGDRLTLIESDCFATLDAGRERFQIIVSNPPYITEHDLAGLQREVREHEPRGALTPGGNGLRVIQTLLTDAPQFLEAGGLLLFEIGFNQHQAVAELINPQRWTLLDIHQDLQGIPRTVALRKK